ncbi:MAG: biosis protein MshI [Proteobacteria bacterium]|nr:biosis protein MshI [Pseudomonadota bacterium]
MRRQINLVNLALLPPKPFFQFKSMMVALGVLVAGLLLLAAFMRPRLEAYEAAAADAQSRLVAKQAQVKQHEQALTRRLPDPQVAARLSALHDEQEVLQRIDQALQAGGLPNQGRGASVWLYALARQPLSGVWLTGIQVHGESISLEGMALNAEAIPECLTRLNQLPAFQGQHFAAFEVSRQTLGGADAKKAVEVLRFRLESAMAGEGKR